MKGIIMAFILALVFSVVFGPVADSEMAKEGTMSGTVYCAGPHKIIPLNKERYVLVCDNDTSSLPIFSKQIQGVEVTNDENNPIPMAPAVDVNVINEPSTSRNVEVINTPNRNAPKEPSQLEVSNGAIFPRKPFQWSDYRANIDGMGDGTGFGVPTGKILVIETINAWAFLPKTQGFWRFYIETKLNGHYEYHHFPIFKQVEMEVSAYYSACHAVRIYADSETFVFVKIQRTSDDGFFSWNPTIVGYLIPYDSPSLAP